MNTLFPQILQLLVTSPGNLIYHLVLAFALMSGLQAVINQRQGGNRATSDRYILGFLVLLAGQLILFVSSALVWQAVADPQQFLPVFDRVITTISMLWIGWMWAFPLQNRSVDTINLILTLALLALAGISFVFWLPQVGVTNFNQTNLNNVWTALDITIAITAVGSLFYLRQGNWGVGFGFFIIMLLGTISQLLWGDPGQDFAPIIRLAQLCVYPLLPSLARNLSSYQAKSEIDTNHADGSGRQSGLRKQLKVDTPTAVAWMQVAKSESPQEICPAIIQAIGRSLTADLCFLIVAPDKQTAVLQCGYDLIREESLPGLAIDQKKIPQITNSLNHSKPIRIPWSGEEISSDLVSLASVTGVKATGHLLAAPVSLPQVVWGGIILISPYSKYEWNKEDQAALISICEQATPLLSPAFAVKETQSLLTNRRIFTSSTSELEQAHEEQKLLLAEIEKLREQVNIAPHPIEVEKLLAAQEESREIILRLEADNRELREALHDGRISAENESVKADLRAALDENTHIQALLAESRQMIKVLEEQTSQLAVGSGSKDKKAILKTIQKIRQPIFSILGYADLLSWESRSQLSPTGSMYLDRIETSIDRMRSLLDEIKLSPFDTSPIELAPQELNLNDILEQVLSNLSNQLQEKKISLQVDISESLPMVYADKDALHQILLHLLQNAGSATPIEGTIHITVKVEPSGQAAPYMMLQVTDEGGGIAAEDLGRLFTRKTVGKYEPISGLGENGLGLSITKTLVEAHGGRIWVESDNVKTTTITLLLPLRANVANGTPQAS